MNKERKRKRERQREGGGERQRKRDREREREIEREGDIIVVGKILKKLVRFFNQFTTTVTLYC